MAETITQFLFLIICLSATLLWLRWAVTQITLELRRKNKKDDEIATLKKRIENIKTEANRAADSAFDNSNAFDQLYQSYQNSLARNIELKRQIKALKKRTIK